MPLAGQASLWRAEYYRTIERQKKQRKNSANTKTAKGQKSEVRIRYHRIPFCVARHKEPKKNLAHGSAQGFVLERSAKRGVKSFAPLWGKPPYGAPKAPVESGGFLARHKCTRRPRARQCAGIRARAEREARKPRQGMTKELLCEYYQKRSARRENRGRE